MKKIRFTGKYDPQITFSGEVIERRSNGVTVRLKDGSREFVHNSRRLYRSDKLQRWVIIPD